jgi:hypothetical protein
MRTPHARAREITAFDAPKRRLPFRDGASPRGALMCVIPAFLPPVLLSQLMRDFKAKDPAKRTPEQTAIDLGLLDVLPHRPPSPYRMVGSKNNNHEHIVFKSPLGVEPTDDVSTNAKVISAERVAALATPVRPYLISPKRSGPLGSSPTRVFSPSAMGASEASSLQAMEA